MLGLLQKRFSVFIYAIILLTTPLGGYAQEASQNGTTPTYISALCKELIEKGKTVEKLTEKDMFDLPVGIARQVGGVTMVIAIDSAQWTRDGWYFSAYASVIFPGATRPLAFRGNHIAFNDAGLAASSQVKLMLVENSTIALGNHIDLRFPTNGYNYVEFNCDGFKAVNFKGEFVFDNTLLVPDYGEIQAKKNTPAQPAATEVTASFETHTADPRNVMTTVQITPFRIPKLRNLAFEVKDAVVDFSDLVNPTGFSFPQDYQQAYGSDIALWQGFYLRDVAIRFHGLNEDNTPPTIAAHNLILDDNGVSGAFSATNLIRNDVEQYGGWSFSVDAIGVQLVMGKLRGGALEGEMNVPLLGKKPVGYKAMIEQGDSTMNYRFSIKVIPGKEFDTGFGATITLAENSTLSVESTGGAFIPSAILHGEISFKTKVITAEKIRFQNLHLTKRKPYVLSGEFASLAQNGSGGGYPIHIDSIRLRIYQGELGFAFGVAMNFMNKEDKGFAATTNIEMLVKMRADTTLIQRGEKEEQKLDHKWQLHKVKVNKVTLACQTQAFTLNGELAFFDDDPAYGDGFKGSLAFSIKKILDKGVKVSAYFGSMPTYRYWHVDAYVPTGNILIVPPALFLNGIIGGASYHMARKQPFVPNFNTLNGSNTAAKQPQGDQFVFVPDNSVALSFMAGVTLIAGNEKAFNSDAVLEVAFREGGGIRYAQFNGSGYFFTGIDKREKSGEGQKPTAPVYASLGMLYDNDNDVFHANLKTYVNLAGGLIKGTGPNSLMGEAVIHIDKKDWYMYIGRPSQMLGLDIARVAVAQSYFMIGTQIEDLPLPPSQVREVFDDIDMGMMRDGTALSGGRGFATGARFQTGFDSKNKLNPFYAALTVGAGADIMLRDYGNAYCSGQSGPVGISGWYASGQAYVFLNGRVGIQVRKRKFDFLSLGAAALLQAKLPNPTWLKGQLGGKYSVLGGLVKGKFNLTLEVGDECELINPGGALDDIEIIADIKPDDGSTGVSVFAAPQVSFNTAVDTEFNMMDVNDNLNAYRIRFGEFTIKHNGKPLTGKQEWNTTKDVLAIRTAEILPPKANLTAIAKIYWEQKNANGQWEAMKEDGQTYYEVKERSFITGEAPNFIPEENVAYSYPVKYQYNLHVKESGQGYVKLTTGQGYLFNTVTDDGTRWNFTARFKDTKGNVQDVTLHYDAGQTQATFTVPDNLITQTLYTLSFIKSPQQTGGIDSNVKRTAQTMSSQQGNEVSVASNGLEGTITQSVDKEIYSTAFRTSSFERFADKIATLNNTQDLFDVAVGNVAVIGKRGTLSETFDAIELSGSNGKNEPLIQVVADGTTEWMANKISPKLYQYYPIREDIRIDWRDPQALGVKPLKGVVLKNDLETYKLTDANIKAAYAPVHQGSVLLGYFVSYYTYWDYVELRDEAGALYLSGTGSSQGIKNLLSGGYIDLLPGNYPVEIRYVMPGTNQVTHTQKINIRF